MKTVTNKAYQRRLNQLIEAVSTHTYRSELLNLMEEQLVEDTYSIETPYTNGQYSPMDKITVGSI